MSLNERIQNAKTSSWLKDSIGKDKFEEIQKNAIIAAKIYLRRKEMGLTQKEFAKLMNVSQVMVSKWEKGDYNFTVRNIAELENKLEIELIDVHKPKESFQVIIKKKNYKFKNDYGGLLWN